MQELDPDIGAGAGARLPRIAITIGDVNGIGPEVMFKALAQSAVHEQCSPVVYGNERLLAGYAGALQLHGLRVDAGAVTIAGRSIPIVEIASDAEPQIGMRDAGAGSLAGRAIEAAVADAVGMNVDAIVTMPISKEGLNAGGFNFPGHTEMLAALAGGEPLMILMAEGMRVAPATIHIPLASVSGAVSAPLVETRIAQLRAALEEDFGIAAPRIAVLGLNPHAGERGLLGREEIDAIAPAIARARLAGTDAHGPHPADGFFAHYQAADQDAVLAMYHDQGLIPLKMFARGHGVNVTAGLPIVRTSPDHGTAYDIAGMGSADAASTLEAIAAAARIARNRKRRSVERGG